MKSRSWPNPVPAATFESAIDYADALLAGRAKAMQGRQVPRPKLTCVELCSVGWVRLANITLTPPIVLTFLSELLFEQARLAESEALARASIEVLDAVGYGRDSGAYVNALGKLCHGCLFSAAI